MKNWLLLLIFASIINPASASEPTTPTPDIIVLPDNPMDDAEYDESDKNKVESLLKAAKTERKSEHPIVYFAKKFLGIPYVAHTLESGNKEHLIVNLREMDCTTFVEYVLALAICDKKDARTFEDFCWTLNDIRYNGGRMNSYADRLHYFTWWAEDNEQMGFVKDIAPKIKKKPVEPFTAVQTININYMSKHPNQYKRLKDNQYLVNMIKRHEENTNGKQYYYIPKSKLNGNQSSVLGKVKSGDIIAFLTDKDGLDTRHIGIAYWQGDKLYFIHASSLYKKVLVNPQTLYTYETKQTKHTGIRVFRMQ